MTDSAIQRQRQKQIEKLENKAANIRVLLDKGTLKRPLILEFSGTPKAGKTSTISVLGLFLRRNGFQSKVFAERASISPIKKKGHPDFNLWVACSTFQGLLEALQEPIDIFIFDRGIFDILWWNRWLERTGKIDSQEAKLVSDFCTMKRWLRLVDLVCVMTCSPEVALEREYSNQLTLKRGTIMNESTLKLQNECIKEVVEKYGHFFKQIYTVDTSKTNTIEGSTKITMKTLEALHDLADESLCVLPRDALSFDLPNNGFLSDPSLVEAIGKTLAKEKCFIPRSKAEKDPSYLQIIPCAVVRFENKVLLLKRKDPGSSLHDTFAIWAGGHILELDDGKDILLNGLKRELEEELYIRDDFELEPLGIVRTDETKRASRHIGVVYQLNLSSPHVALALHQREFRETRGRSMSGRLVEIKELKQYIGNMGAWARFLVEYYLPEQVEPRRLL